MLEQSSACALPGGTTPWSECLLLSITRSKAERWLTANLGRLSGRCEGPLWVGFRH